MSARFRFMILPDLGGRHSTGPLAEQLSDVDVAGLVGRAVSAAVCLPLTRSLDLTGERAAEAASDRQVAGRPVAGAVA